MNNTESLTEKEQKTLINNAIDFVHKHQYDKNVTYSFEYLSGQSHRGRRIDIKKGALLLVIAQSFKEYGNGFSGQSPHLGALAVSPKEAKLTNYGINHGSYLYLIWDRKTRAEDIDLTKEGLWNTQMREINSELELLLKTYADRYRQKQLEGEEWLRSVEEEKARFVENAFA